MMRSGDCARTQARSGAQFSAKCGFPGLRCVSEIWMTRAMGRFVSLVPLLSTAAGARLHMRRGLYKCSKPPVTSPNNRRGPGQNWLVAADKHGRRLMRSGLRWTVLAAAALCATLPARAATTVEFWHAMSGALGERVD